MIVFPFPCVFWFPLMDDDILDSIAYLHNVKDYLPYATNWVKPFLGLILCTP